jgi:gamma-glutamyltranspeptidase/glutathione hydrolase
VDAVVAAALVAGVVALPSCGIGGYGGHMVIAQPGGKVVAIDFNSTAPAAARAGMFPLDERGQVKGRVNTHGWLAVGVPGTLAGLQLALDRHGTLRFARLVQPALRYARAGFPVSRRLATLLARRAARLRGDPGSAKLFYPGGKPLREGDTFRNPDLADLLQRLAEHGSVEPFYRGAIAGRIAAACKKNGGLVTAADLAAYRARAVAPLTLAWRGATIHTAPLTAGGLTVLQALATLRALDWGKGDVKGPAATQERVEALRIAWHDRLRLLGDPEQVAVPVERLLSERLARESAARVRSAIKAKKPVKAESDGRSAGGTIHLTAADAAGMMVALTLTHGEGFGAQVTVDGLGLILGHGMSRFDPHPGRANSPGPGKRPLHNMCPTVVCRAGRPVLALGATGDRRIPNSLFDVLAYHVGAGQTLAEAVRGPRLHTEGDTRLTLEAGWPAAVVKHFKEAGYTVRTGPGATLNAIEREPASGALRSAAR